MTTANRTIEIEIDLKPDVIAEAVLKSPSNKKTYVAARGGHKTGVGTMYQFLKAIGHGEKYRRVTVAPVYEQAEESMHLAEMHMHQFIATGGVNWSKHRITTLTGSRIYYRSADKPENIRGRHYNGAHVIEAGYIDDYTWHAVISRTLHARNGDWLIEGTPNGAGNWLHVEYLKGQRKEDGRESWLVDGQHSPWISKEQLDEAERSMPRRLFLQEMMCEFLSGDGIVFERLPLADYNVDEKPVGNVIFGVDLAKLVDYTVITGVDTTGRVVFFKRMNKLPYNEQVQIAAHWARKFGATIYLDATCVGQAVLDILRQCYDRIVPITFTSDMKRNLVENLITCFEQGKITIAKSLTDLIGELQVFGAKYYSGGIKYSAPSNAHDDCVMSLALAAWGSRVEKREYVTVI